MLHKTEPIKLFFWQRENLYDPKISFLAMNTHNMAYDATKNAQQLARFLMNSVPSNTNDIVFQAIADEILPMLNNQKSIEILKTPYDLTNRIRGALERLERGEK